MALHRNMTGSDLHEPKGVASASTGQVYAANGSGSGVWKKVTISELDTSSIFGLNKYFLSAVLPDVSTASNIIVPVPVLSVFDKANIVLGDGITSSNSVLTFTRNDAASLGSNLTIVQADSGEGDAYTFTPSSNTTISAGGFIKIASDGGSSTAAPLFITLSFTRSE